MSITELQQVWEGWGEHDPLWAVLSTPETRGGLWDPEEFFATGRQEIDSLMQRLMQLQLPERKESCLDFGCGVGRLTQGLARHFDRCDGIDIAASMVERARVFNRHGDRCTYGVNVRNDLSLFPANRFDLIYSRLVLQHVPEDLIRAYLPEFVRVLRPRGIAVLHIPVGTLSAPVPRPMSDKVYQAEIEVIDIPQVVSAGTIFRCRLRVCNTGGGPWPAAREGAINVANHWLDRQGRVVTWDGQRATLPDLSPGQKVEISLAVAAPVDCCGALVIELDIVHEGVCWFASRGSQSVRREITIGEAPAPRPPVPPDWKMHGLPREEVTQLVRKAGGIILGVEEYDTDRAYHDTCYYITKSRRSIFPFHYKGSKVGDGTAWRRRV